MVEAVVPPASPSPHSGRKGSVSLPTEHQLRVPEGAEVQSNLDIALSGSGSRESSEMGCT
jgi:hypothetical protein